MVLRRGGVVLGGGGVIIGGGEVAAKIDASEEISPR